MAGTKGGKGGPKRQAKGGAEAAHSSSSRGSATQQRPAQGEEAQQQREELIRRYLLHRVQAAEAAAANHSAGGDAGSSGEEGGSAAGGASAAAFLQLLAEASVRQSEVRLAIRRAGRELGLPPKKAKFLESVESRLAKHGPLLYQNASIAAGTSEWQQRRVSSKERFTEDPVRFELQLDHFELNPEATMQKILEKGRQPADASPLAAAAAALAAAQVDVKRVKIQPLRAHSCLFVDRLPTPAELVAPPPDEAAASRTENRLQLMAGQLFEELATLQHATRLAQAGFPSDHVSRMGGLASRCEYLDGRIQLAMIGTRLADDVLEALEPGMWTQRIAALVSNQHRTLHILHDAVHDSDVEVVLPSAVRGHLLMQLQAKAAALGWSGVPPELQRALRPLALIAEQLDAGERDVLLELVAVACSEQQGGGQSSLAARPPPSGSTEEEASTIKYVRVAASQLASDERRRGMAAAIVLALARMQLRRRLYDEAVLGLMRFVEEELSIDMASPFDTLRQLGALPPDSLLLAYSYVAVMFGLSFPSPDELGSSAAAASRVPHLAALGGADLALASLLCREGALEWEPQAAGSGGGAAADAKLRLGPEGVDGLLHWQAAAKEQQQEQQQGEGQLDSEATLPAVPRFPGTHCSVGWCPECRGVLPPDASTEDKVAALAALACGSAGSTALVQGAPGSQAPPAVQDAQEPVERLFNDEPLLAGTEIEAVPELLVEQIHTLHILGATCYVLHTRVRDVVHQARETLQFMEILASSLCGPGEHRPLPFRAEMLKQHAEAANSLAEIDTRVRMAHLMTERLRLLANHHRLQQAQELAHSVLSADGKEARILLLIVDALQEIVRDSRESVNQLQHQLDNPREAAQWAVQLRVTLNVLHAGAAAHEAQIAQGAITNTKQPYSPPISLAKKLDGPLEEMRDLSRNAHNQTKLLEAASTMLHLRAQTLVGQLRRLCHVNLLLPLESFVLQHMLAPRWEKEAAARLGQGSVTATGSTAAEQAAAEEAARRLLEEESAKEEAEQRRRRQKEERQRAAEQKRLADIEAKRKVEQEEQRKAAAEQRRQEEEAAARQRAVEQAAAEKAARRQRAAAHAAAVAAGIAEEEEEEESEGEEEGGAAAPGEQQRKRHVRGGAKRREKREARLAREAAAAAAIPGFTPLPPAASPSKKAAAPAAAPAAAAAPVTLPATQQAAAAATPAADAAAADRPMGAERRQQQQAVQQQAVQQPAQQRPTSPQDQLLARAGSSSSVGSTGGAGSGAAGSSKQTSPAVDAKPGLNFLAALAPEQAEVAVLALPGLRNESGEFNCFLNVVLQCLWRCADFRAEVLGWVPAVYRGDAVLKALHGLFCELTALDMQSKEAAAAAASGASPPRRQRPVIDPTPLREALNALPSQEFKMGEMSDAGELLLVLYEHIQAAAPAEAAAAAVDRAFGLHIAEAVRCQKCGRVTQEGRYTQYFHNVPAVALRGSLRSGADPGFGARLRALEDKHQKTCDTDVGGCGAPWPLVWESHNQEPSAIGATLRAVGETVDLSQLYANVPGGARYRLRSLACYYGRHYSAFVRLPELHDRWVMFDDASASAIGSWADVRRRCEGGRIQPSVLFYEAEFEQ
ncbi:hypothetical protein COHA_005331 [Chlorella ohadii]|uniref:USP domain-containing protein n=1 Tax=Chlorella ohadii TaxID=2649997 RepID=A0AAD5DQ83_9CHLO|nr:hypothetical protein COHA_005331 [Chlorella ohadii]